MGQKENQVYMELFEEIITLFFDNNERLSKLKYSELDKIERYRFMLYLKDSSLSENQRTQLINILL